MDALRGTDRSLLVRRYEDLRAEVGGRSRVGHQLFCRRGLAAWLVEWGCVPGRSKAEHPVSSRPFVAAELPLSPDRVAPLTMVVASLVQQVLAGAPSC